MTSASDFKKPAAVNTDDQQTQRKVGFELDWDFLKRKTAQQNGVQAERLA